MNLPYHRGAADLHSDPIRSQNGTTLKEFSPKSSARACGMSTLMGLAE
jgi:hypothetical protein